MRGPLTLPQPHLTHRTVAPRMHAFPGSALAIALSRPSRLALTLVSRNPSLSLRRTKGVHFKPAQRGPRVQRLEALPGGLRGPLQRDGRVAQGDVLKAIQNTRTTELT